MGQHNHIKIFPLQTISNLTATQQDPWCRASTTRLDWRRLQRTKWSRKLDRQPLEKSNHHYIECNLSINFILVDNKGRRTRFSIRPADKYNNQHINKGRHRKGGLGPRTLGSQGTRTHTHTLDARGNIWILEPPCLLRMPPSYQPLERAQEHTQMILRTHWRQPQGTMLRERKTLPQDQETEGR